MKPQIPWLRVFVEGVVIVGSILLAFGIDAWWDGRQEREEEQEILEGLKADFAANRDELLATIRQHLRYGSAITRLQAMTATDQAAIPRDSVGEYLIAMRGRATYDARDGTLDAVTASGRLGVISDPELRDRLVEWKSAVQDAVEREPPAVSGAEAVIAREAELGGPFRDLAPGSTRETVIEEAMASWAYADLSVLAQDDELMTLVRAGRAWSVFYIQGLHPLVEYADSVLALIEGNLR